MDEETGKEKQSTEINDETEEESAVNNHKQKHSEFHSKPDYSQKPKSHNLLNKQQEKPLSKLTTRQWLTLLYDKNYRFLLLIPLLLLILSLAYLGYQYKQTGDFINKDITLTGGTSITFFIEQEVNIKDLSSELSEKTSDFAVKELSDFRTGKQKAIIVDSKLDPEELKSVLEEILGFELTSENSTVESTGTSLGESFYNQLRLAIVISFILMSIVVFIIFRNFVPSTAVVISAFADIVMTLAFIDYLGVKVSSAGITAVLMLIGYSVDSDIMLTTRLLKRGDEVNKNLWGAFKTGMTMTLTSLSAVLVAYLITQSLSNVLGQIFLVLIVGLVFDIFNTYITNVSILKWYLERKK